MATCHQWILLLALANRVTYFDHWWIGSGVTLHTVADMPSTPRNSCKAILDKIRIQEYCRRRLEVIQGQGLWIAPGMEAYGLVQITEHHLVFRVTIHGWPPIPCHDSLLPFAAGTRIHASSIHIPLPRPHWTFSRLDLLPRKHHWIRLWEFTLFGQAIPKAKTPIQWPGYPIRK